MRRWHPCILAILALTAIGCVSEYHGEFKGSVKRGDEFIAPAGTHQLGGSFSSWPKDSKVALYGISLGIPLDRAGVCLVFVVHRKAVLEQGKPTNNAVSAVYLSTANRTRKGVWKRFLEQSTEETDRLGDTHRLHGSFDIQRWKSNVDYRIKLSMRSDGPQPFNVHGTVAEYEQWEFSPRKWLAMLLFQSGLAGEGG